LKENRIVSVGQDLWFIAVTYQHLSELTALTL